MKEKIESYLSWEYLKWIIPIILFFFGLSQPQYDRYNRDFLFYLIISAAWIGYLIGHLNGGYDKGLDDGYEKGYRDTVKHWEEDIANFSKSGLSLENYEKLNEEITNAMNASHNREEEEKMINKLMARYFKLKPDRKLQS